MSLMVLIDVEWVRELATFCSYDTSYQMFKTQATITQNFIELRPFLEGENMKIELRSARLCFKLVTFSPVLTFGMILVE